MRRKKGHEDHVNHEAWAIPYADLMTLLLAFFVVMYAVSVVNEGKYRVMSQSIIEAFNGNNKTIQPVHSNNAPQVAPVPSSRQSSTTPPSLTPHMAVPLPSRALQPQITQPGVPIHRDPGQENLARIQDQVQQALQPLIDKSLVIVRRTNTWLEIEIRTDILFPSGVAKLSPQADNTLRNIADILAPFPNPLRVEGYTDDMPISNVVYPSNWELSAARAASVARLFSENGVDANRLGIIGWGQTRPAAENDSTEGRNRNRRVLVVVLSDEQAPARFYSDAGQPGQLAQQPQTTPGSEASAPATLPVPATLMPAAAPAARAQVVPEQGTVVVSSHGAG
ncbi:MULTISPECIES: flagellar motor protein MotD [Dyella]|uniref:Flagellar motor protein MotD n=2 Tax=Dyella TaxID=231454 RepID=A0A4R0YPI9_9GAMM|nr:MULTISPECIES: flagellar motor protein MotD [Dyella]TBR37217.1 flagellar motor protein MotD [Dyella terrae]TCI07693.1 flagellar motor protein MotD [Dyella soli]